MLQKQFSLQLKRLSKFIGVFVFIGTVGYMLLFISIFMCGFIFLHVIGIIIGICVNTVGVIVGLVMIKKVFQYDGSLPIGASVIILTSIIVILVSLPSIHTLPREIMSGAYPVTNVVLVTAFMGTIGYHLNRIIPKLLPSAKS